MSNHSRSLARAASADLRAAVNLTVAAQVAEALGVIDRRTAARLVEIARVKLTRDDLIGATQVRDRCGWWPVITVNKATVTIETGYSWNERIPFDRILEVRR